MARRTTKIVGGKGQRGGQEKGRTAANGQTWTRRMVCKICGTVGEVQVK